MPRYFFHVLDGCDYRDLQGTELADLNVARREAVRFAGALLTDEPDNFWGTDTWRMRVTDDYGFTLFELTFSATDGAPDPS